MFCEKAVTMLVSKIRVACIGASVAGLGTALELLKLDRSIDVTLFDKKPHVGANTVCGGAISSFMLRELKMEFPSYVTASEIRKVRIYGPNGEFWQLESESGETYGYVLWREKFERDLAKQVAELGGKIRMNNEIRDLNELSEYDYIVGADGLTGITSKLIGFPNRDDVHIAIQRIAHMNNSHKERIDLYFGREIAPSGYAWIFPAGYRKQVRIGLGVPLSLKVNPNKLLDGFMKMVDAEPLSKPKGKLIPTAKPPKNLVYGKVLLVGDAAHLCDPLTGGGIANALLSGKYAAKTIVEGDLERYNSYCKGLKRRNLMRYKLKRILYELSDDELNIMIKAMKDFKPKLTRISWTIMHALLTLALKEPNLLTRHRILRKVIKP